MSKQTVFNINEYGVGIGTLTTGTETTPQLNFNDNWIVENFFPIGTIHLSIDSINPAKYFGGVWEKFGQGRTLVCVDEDDATDVFSSVLNKGGNKTHTLVTNEMPNHRHLHAEDSKKIKSRGGVDRPYDYSNVSTLWASNYTGNSQPHNNLQPYITCYMWVRLA